MFLLKGFWTFFAGRDLVSLLGLSILLFSFSNSFADEAEKNNTSDDSLDTYLEGIAQTMGEHCKIDS